MSINQFSSLFELLAGLNLAYAGIDSFRRKVFEILADFFTPPDLKEDIADIDAKVAAISIGANSSKQEQKILDKVNYIKNYLQAEHDRIIKEDEDFLSERKSFKPIFFMGFLFCFGNLILIGYEQFFVTYSSVIAEQWLFVSFVYIILVFLGKPVKVVDFLQKHYGIFLWFVAVLVLTFGFSFCQWRLTTFQYIDEFVVTGSVLIAISPFIIDYFVVRSYIKKRSPKIETYLSEVKNKLGEVNTILDFIVDV